MTSRRLRIFGAGAPSYKPCRRRFCPAISLSVSQVIEKRCRNANDSSRSDSCMVVVGWPSVGIGGSVANLRDEFLVVVKPLARLSNQPPGLGLLFRNFSLPLARWLSCFTLYSTGLLVIGSPARRYRG